MKHLKALTLPVLLLTLLLAACSDNTRVGSEKLDIKDGTTSTRLGETTTTEAPVTTTSTTVKGATTTARPTTTTPRAPSITIKIQHDSQGAAFQPSVAQVRRGSVVRWENIDKTGTARSVVFDDESYDSGPIAAGSFKDYTANRAGTINYHDGTRPYAVASLQVVQ